MMKLTSVIALLAGALSQQPGPPRREVTHEKHPPVQLSTPLLIEPAASQSAFQQLLKIVVENHIPMGMIIGADAGICRTSFALNPGEQTVEDLIQYIKANLPGYSAALQDGVLEVFPEVLPDGVSKLLNLRLPTIGIPANSLHLMGSDLWMDISLVLRPKEGAVGGGLSSTLTEVAPGFQTSNQTVLSILNKIADAASGGVWILHTSAVKDLPSTRQQPYEIYGYLGEQQHVIDLRCSD